MGARGRESIAITDQSSNLCPRPIRGSEFKMPYETFGATLPWMAGGNVRWHEDRMAQHKPVCQSPEANRPRQSLYSSSLQEGLVYQPTAAFSLAALMNDWWLSSRPVTGSRSGRKVSTRSLDTSRAVVSSAFRK